jgi:protein-tyrosine-phosphatase
MPSVLFVCTANICRSPMAAALFQQLVAQQANVAGWRIESAGTWALEGQPAAEKSRLVMQRRGLDLSQHRSRTVTAEILRSFDLILTMEGSHKEALRVEFSTDRGKIYLLSEMVGLLYDVPDPIGSDEADFEATANEIGDLLARGFPKILRLLAHSQNIQSVT